MNVPEDESEGTSKAFTCHLLYRDPISEYSHECSTGGDEEVAISCDCNPHDKNSDWVIGDFELLDAIDCWAEVDCRLCPAQCDEDFYILNLIDF